ncbi:cytochrome P450 6j1-like isoform X2 [Diabrotica virgifera virgifera]|uniref:Cytochrome P450 6k1-like n=1 Tax=Diabrotica virgifera virgifera TaxID=50390 RepID=A0ABM5KUH9_DIAVI|nr:cytochrome P450 6j1-like isoform X2 [Diabrotica virgifera virgifera]
MVIFLILLVTIIFLAYKYFTRHFDYWKKRGVHTKKPIPFFGHFYRTATFQTTLSELIQDLYHETDEPYFGVFAFDRPILVVKSPKLIKDILIKDFNTFCDRTVADPTHHPLLSKFLFWQKIAKWRHTRTKLTPLFTSSMTKIFFENLQLINEKFVEYLGNIQGPFDAKYVAGHYSTEMIGRCFFAIDPRCFEETTTEFRDCVERIFEFNLRNGFIQTCYFLRQGLVKFFKLSFLASSDISHFEQTFLNSMESRKKYDGRILNMVDLLNDLDRKHDGNYPDKDILISNAIFLLIAGQETTSAIVAYTLYELALHQDIQERLRNEIKNNYEIYQGFTYEGIQKNKYLDMVINECLRKYGVLPFLDREAVSDYRLEGTDLVIEKGTGVYIPLFAFMRDPKYFPNPEKFDPERFADNNVNAEELLYFPFGEGPRACIVYEPEPYKQFINNYIVYNNFLTTWIEIHPRNS